ncbi:MAG TPA: helix-turn-helix transcriptional regulator [Oscillatoriaceae cyanobacterium M33_DOE_052]|uniref:XRE family transcriptional regulator n=1 Tax=Planktothricoides sp. SpSt-374 TaxID=2282167 RepID=A0A7C3ZPW4_9CYAN|nr:helix-turn-helix transcriptional regulator [Oscillatoriaceae cyanobacterium M33_DOE_052]
MATWSNYYFVIVATNPHLKQFGTRVRSLRKERGLSQEQLGELSQLHRNYIGGIERGERNLSFLNILRLAKGLGISPSELLENIS